jgi:hypothetical protein
MFWEVSFGEFLFVTVILGGAGAWMTGRAFARSWLDHGRLAGSILLLTAAVRFIHFALFSGSLIAPWYFVVDFVVLLAIGFLGMRVTRAGQMVSRYGFLYRRTGPIGWARGAAQR